MATDAGSIYVRVAADTKGFKRDMGRVSSSIKGVAKVAGIGALAIGGGLAVALKKSLDSAIEHEKALAQTNAVLKSTGGAANVTARQITGLADAIEKKTGFDDLAVQSGANLLLTFTNIRNEVGKGNDIFNQATKTAVDMSVALGQDMKSSAIQLGKALNDPVRGMTALQRVGVSFTAEQKKMVEQLVKSGDTLGAQKLILGELKKEFGGSADAMGKTFGGQLNILKARLDDVAQKIGEKLLPALTSAVSWISDHWPQISAVVGTVADAIGDAFGEVARFATTHWGTVKTVVSGATSVALGAMRGVVNFVRSDWGRAMLVAAGAVGGLATGIKGIQGAVAIANKALGLLQKNPMWLAAAGLAALLTPLAAGFLAVRNRASEVNDVVRRAVDSVRALGSAVDALTQADLNLDQAKLRVQQTTLNMTTAEKNYADAVKTGGKNSIPARQALLDLNQAKLDARQADLDLGRAVDEHKAKEKERTDALKGTTSALDDARKKTDDLTSGSLTLGDGLKKPWAALTKFYDALNEEDNLNKFTVGMLNMGQEAVTSAGKLARVDPAAAAAQLKVGELALAAAGLTKELGRVPTKKEIIARAKVMDKDPFFKSLAEIIRKSTQSGKDASKGMGDAMSKMPDDAARIVGLANAGMMGQQRGATQAGYAVGAAAAVGAVSGLDGLSSRMAAKIIGEVRAAIAIAGANLHGSGPFQFTRHEVGEPMAQGVADGFMSKAGAMAIAFASALDKAVQAAVEKAKAKWAPVIDALSSMVTQAIGGTIGAKQTKSEKKLAAMEAEDAAIASARTLATAKEDVAKASAAARAAQQAYNNSVVAAILAQQEYDAALASGSQEQIEATKAAADAASQAEIDSYDALVKANEEKVAADQGLYDVRRQMQKDELAAKAAEERKQMDAANAETMRKVDLQIAEMQRKLQEGSITYAQYVEGLTKLLKKYDVNFKNAGDALGSAFAKGLEGQIEAARKAAQKIVDAVAEVLGATPTKPDPSKPTPPPSRGNDMGRRGNALPVGPGSSSRAGGQTINLMMDGKTVAEVVIAHGNARVRRGGAILRAGAVAT